MINVKLQSNIWKFYLYSFVRNLFFIIPVLVPFWQENGLNLTQIMFLESIFAITIVIMEIPTGVVADKFGRKTSMICGSLFLVFGALTYSLGNSFYQFALAEIIWAVGNTFFSGADSAFVYDTLKQSKKESSFKKVWGNANALTYLGAGLAGIAGGLIAKHSLRLDWYLVVISMISAFFIVLTFTEPVHFKKTSKKQYFKHTKECIKESFTNKNLFFLLLFYSLLFSMSMIIFWFYQPYMQKVGIDISLFGIIWASFCLFSLLGSKFAHKIENVLKEKLSLWLIVLLMVIGTLFMGIWILVWGIIFIFILQVAWGFSEVILQDYTNKHISTEKRATLLSVQSMAGRLSFAVLGPIFGFIADKYSLRTSIMIVALSFFAAFVILMLWKNNIK